MRFGEYIKEIRKEKGLSIREVAKRSGVSHPYLSQLETGNNKNPSPDIVQKISSGLNVDFYDLWFVFSKSVQEEYIKEQKEKELKESTKEFIKKMNEGTLFEMTIPVKVPTRIEFEFKENHKINKETKESDLFDLFYLLQMDKEIYFNEKKLTDDDKRLLIQILNRFFPK